MIELATPKKTRICLSDYDYQADIERRILLSQLSKDEVLVLEELTYNTLQIPISKMAKNLSISSQSLLDSLDKWIDIGFVKIDKETICITKEMRKYFEVELDRFQDFFNPGVDFLQSLLKKIPIHVLPMWYVLPRGSDHIFNSILEKYLSSPFIFQRYLDEVKLELPVLAPFIEELFRSENLELDVDKMQDKYHLSDKDLEERLLLLELHLIGCVIYRPSGQRFERKIVPFIEWKEYLLFIKHTEIISDVSADVIHELDLRDFGFVQDLAKILYQVYCTPTGATDTLFQQFSQLEEQHQKNLIGRLFSLQLLENCDGKVFCTETGKTWLEMRNENKALFLYRYPSTCSQLPKDLNHEKSVRETEKSILRVLNKGWVCFDEFLKGVHVGIGNQPPVHLTKIGKTWKYLLPSYTEEHRHFLRTLVMDFFSQCGIIKTGTFQGRQYFKVTPFGRALFN